jgi:cytochrome oxidase Cu insertion factor (SCO1/SenC/PrrC family)
MTPTRVRSRALVVLIAPVALAAVIVLGCSPAAVEPSSPVTPELPATRVEAGLSPAGATPSANATDCCKTETPGTQEGEPAERLQVPDVTLVNQDGKPVRLTADLIGRRVVVVNFLFTTCTTSCPLLGGKFGELQHQLGDKLGAEYGLISISVDPITDTPERLKEFGRRYKAGPGWTLVTGQKPEIERVLKAFGVYTPDKQNHPSTVVVFDGVTGKARRSNGLASAAQLAELVRKAAADRAQPGLAPGGDVRGDAARKYFTDTELVDQTGRKVRFYSDLMHDKVVVINTFFSSCTGSCVRLAGALKAFQDRYPDRLGKDLHLISISVDPDTDRPDVLRDYAARLGAKPGWFLLTGERANVEFVLGKLGQWVPNKESHSAILLMGNDRTGLWKKGFGLSDPPSLFPMFDGVINDRVP